MTKIIFTSLFLIISLNVFAQGKSTNEFTLVTYNIENLFDADGIAVFNDYKTTDRIGNPQYTKEDVLTKIQNAVRVMEQYNDGKGPDVIAMVELESDFTPDEERDPDPDKYLSEYENTTLEKMLGEDFNSKIADLPSHLLLLKGMIDVGMWKYNLAVGKSTLNNRGEPKNVQKTVTYSRFPIQEEKTKIHPLQHARPILETWIDVDGHNLVVFNNHWKSGAGSWDMEKIRLQNAEVLRNRVDDLLEEFPNIDMVLAGDFNSDYNQKHRYGFKKTAVNDKLGSTGDEKKMAEGNPDYLYNLWYEWPLENRGSDVYGGKWGTLMQIMITPGLYDDEGIQYIDNSFSVGDFGFNTYSSTGEPKRWSSTFSGSGYSDHLPVSMKFRVAEENTEYRNYSVNDDKHWKAIDVSYKIPEDYIHENEFNKGDPRTKPQYYDKYVYATATVTDDYSFVVNGITFDTYAPAFSLDDVLSEVAGTDREIKFYGRFSQYRGTWQFVIESPEFMQIVE